MAEAYRAPRLRGFLTKRGDSRIGQLRWKRRYFAFSQDGTLLRYSELSPGQEPAGEAVPGLTPGKVKGEIAVVTMKGVVTPRASKVAQWPTSNPATCLGIECHGRTYYAFADSAEEATRWKLELIRTLMRIGTRPQAARATEDLAALMKSAVTAAAVRDALAGASLVVNPDLDGHAELQTAVDAILAGDGSAAAAAVAVAEGSEIGGEDQPTPTSTPTEAGGIATPPPADAEKHVEQAPTGHGAGGATSAGVGAPEAEAQVAAVWELVEQQGREPIPCAPTTDRKHWQEVRVFVSSTFADMFCEREVLIRKVFPRLRTWCQERRIRIIECDLRVGVPKESTSETIFRTCLGELDRCKATNTNPFFINLLGERYGWVPTDDQVPAGVVSEYNWVPNSSITHMEILHGAFRSANPNAAFFVRTAESLEGLPEEFNAHFIDGSPRSSKALDVLKAKLREEFPTRVYDYSCRVAGTEDISGLRKVQFEGLEPFADHVFEFLKARIEHQYPLSAEPISRLEELEGPQLDRLDEASRFALGREEEVAAALEYLGPDEVPAEGWAPLMFRDTVGTGKGVLLGCIAKEAAAKGYAVFFHSTLAAGGTSSADLVERFCLQFQPEGVEEVPASGDARCKLATQILEGGFKGKAILVVLDAIQTLDDEVQLPLLTMKNSTTFRLVMSSDEDDVHSKAWQTVRDAVEIRAITPLTAAVRKAIVVARLGRFNKKLDEDQMALLVAKESAGNPLWLSVACEELRVFGVFEVMTDKIAAQSDSLEGLLRQVLERVLEEDDSGLLQTAIRYLLGVRRGLTEMDFRVLLARGDPGATPEADSAEAEEGAGTAGGEADSSAAPVADADYVEVEGGGQPPPAEDRGPQPVPMATWAGILQRLSPFVRSVGSVGEFRVLNHLVRKMLVAAIVPAGSSSAFWEPYHRQLAGLFADQPAPRRQPEYPFHLVRAGMLDDLKRYFVTEEWSRLQENAKYDEIMAKIRCSRPVMGARDQIMERMCMQCANGRGALNEIWPGRQRCVGCRARLFTSVMPHQEPRLAAGETFASKCSWHLDPSMRNSKDWIKCVVCAKTAPRSTSAAAILCMRCSVGRFHKKCCTTFAKN